MLWLNHLRRIFEFHRDELLLFTFYLYFFLVGRVRALLSFTDDEGDSSSSIQIRSVEGTQLGRLNLNL